ncbi:MAG: hypothetical protein ACREFC_02150, partial [Stellaceae bacterium]
DTAAYNRINRYGPHAAASIWHHEAHGSGYFHIAQDQITPLKPSPAKGKHAAAKKLKHETKHAKRKSRASRKIARAHAPAHRGKIHVASNARRKCHER